MKQALCRSMHMTGISCTRSSARGENESTNHHHDHYHHHYHHRHHYHYHKSIDRHGEEGNKNKSTTFNAMMLTLPIATDQARVAPRRSHTHIHTRTRTHARRHTRTHAHAHRGLFCVADAAGAGENASAPEGCCTAARM